MSEEVKEITVEELKKKIDSGDPIFLLDVREEFEYQISNLEGALIPLGKLPDRIGEIEDKSADEVIVMCRSGARSAKAVQLLQSKGFKNVKNLAGGINQWAREIDKSMPVY
ncbi:MAG: rhodanese-like domain-containing protein [Balneolaceae bacterium]